MKPKWRVAGPFLAVATLLLAGILLWPWPRVRPPATAGLSTTAPTTAKPTPVPPRYAPNPYLPNPQHRMLLGAFTYLRGEKSMEAAIEGREAAMGRRYDLETTYYRWRDPFPDYGEATIAAHGRTPLMTWYGPGKAHNSHFSLAKINDGNDNAWILRQARAIKRFHKPIWLRLMPEMNGWWYPGYSGDPAAFIAAWRHVYDLFKRARVHNVVWVWCVNLGPHNWDLYYPGNAYVDVIGVDGYNNTSKEHWRSFVQMFGPFFTHFAGRKPLMVAETATNSAHGSAAAFINGMHSYLKDIAGPDYGVIAVCWFDSNDVRGYNWTVNQTPAAWKAWLSLARDPYFGGHGPPGSHSTSTAPAHAAAPAS